MQKVREKMKVEIWSDIACPFCHIGKTNLLNALREFEHKDDVQIIWKSFQLSPDLQFVPGQDGDTGLAHHLGISIQEAHQMNERVAEMAKGVGLTYNMKDMVWANTFDAHRLIQYAQTLRLGADVADRLFQAQFMRGENVGDKALLVRIAGEAGIDQAEAEKVLSSDAFADNVKTDIKEFGTFGATGVPFVIVDQKLAITGANPIARYLSMLSDAYRDWKPKPAFAIIGESGAVCVPGEACD